ncbi:MAG: tol-pal system protein YbgF [Rhizobiaceae bacterium]|nr:tol-pal system protein YbgF [Rhizobiaceae bacterium]
MTKKLLAGMLAIAATAFLALTPVAASAQSVDTELRVQQLEEQLRQMNGRVEEMSFQLLQMQEQLRKAQEDNEFRFQELEGGGKKKKSSLEKPADQDTANNTSGDQTPEVQPGEDAAQLDQPMDDNGNPLDMGTPPIDLGKLEVDKDGNVVGAQEGDPNAVATQDLPPTDTSAVDQDNQTASLNTKASDGDQYRAAYEQVLAGDYASAEAGFSAFIAAHPESKRIADANFWLGEAQYSQAKYSEAAKTFLNAYKTYGKSEKAPEMLLKLAMSLAALDSRDTACATLREVSKAYPKASRAIITKVASEQKRLSCG